jgi:Ca-activated chloride channel homolog
MQEVINILRNKSILSSFTLCVFMTLSIATDAQTDKKFIRQGNREYDKSKFPESEISYRKAVDKNKQSPDALFNVGDALYKQNKFEEAGKQFTENVSENYDRSKKSAGLYNLANSLLKANKLQESIEAYKNSLKLRPGNREAKYNLSYAQDLLKHQQEQQQKQQQNNQDQNKDKKKEDQKKDQKDQNDKNKDQQKKQNDKKDQKQQQKQQQEISKEDAERLLNSLANDEKNVEEKVKLAKAAKTKVRTVKNW